MTDNKTQVMRAWRHSQIQVAIRNACPLISVAITAVDSTRRRHRSVRLKTTDRTAEWQHTARLRPVTDIISDAPLSGTAAAAAARLVSADQFPVLLSVALTARSSGTTGVRMPTSLKPSGGRPLYLAAGLSFSVFYFDA